MAQFGSFGFKGLLAVGVGVLISVTWSHSAWASHGLGVRQPYTSGKDSVVQFRWGWWTDSGVNKWRIGFEQGAWAWDDAQNKVRFGNISNPSPDNVMQVYYWAREGEYTSNDVDGLNEIYK